MRYEIVIILRDGPGAILASFETRKETDDWIAENEIEINDYRFGVAIYDNETDKYDCEGNGKYEPFNECWDAR